MQGLRQNKGDVIMSKKSGYLVEFERDGKKVKGIVRWVDQRLEFTNKALVEIGGEKILKATEKLKVIGFIN
jgi:hypothetical protein